VECKGPGSANDQYILNESHTDIHRFLFVNLNIRYLCKQFSARDILTELDRLQTAQTIDKSMNDSMDPTHDRIMEAILDQPKACASRATQTLACLVTAQRIMTIKELQIAVSLKADMTKLDTLALPDDEKLVDSCFGLVVMDDNTKAVRLVHFTAQDYLNRKKIISPKSDTTLAIACTTYLSLDEFKKPDCPSCNRLIIRCDTHYFFEYAVANLIFHLNSSDQEGTVEAFRRFLDSEGNVVTYYNALLRHYILVRAPGQRISLLGASAIGYAGMVKHLLENGSGISTTDQGLFTSLHFAAYDGHLSVVELLLGKGADPNAVTKRKDTPLNFAAEKGHAEIARLLLDSGADATLANDEMFTPLHKAAQSGNLDLVKLLLERRADPNAVNKQKDTPLNLAAYCGHAGVARLLLDSGADTTLADYEMFTPLHWAALSGHLDLVKLLLESHADPNAVNKRKSTPLNLAVDNGHAEVARLLLDSGADTTLADDEMFTPLHCAAQSGYLDLVKQLLENGADRNAVANRRNTPHDFAAANGHTEVARLLLGGSDVTLADH
jgi:ankyrin repeat protein